MIVTTNDWIPRYEDAGYVQLVRNLALEFLDFDTFVVKLNQQGTLYPLNANLVNELLRDFYTTGLAVNVLLDGSPPEAGIGRPTRPTGLGQNASDIYFSTPAVGSYQVNWYKNGELKISRVQDLATFRSVTKGEMGAIVGDVIQVALVDDNVVSYWGRVTVE